MDFSITCSTHSSEPRNVKLKVDTRDLGRVALVVAKSAGRDWTKPLSFGIS